MSDEARDPEAELRLRNLEAVARHLAQGTSAGTEPLPDATPRWRRRLAGWGSGGAVLAFVLGKGKLLIPLLKATKLTTLLTMVLAVGVYAQIWGLAFALGFVLLIFVHELGHALVLRQQGIPAGPPVFVPFVGAVIAMKGRPRDAYVEALVGVGGPVLGSLGALLCLFVAWATGSLFWYALASTGFFLNLFNLIPISPLDGGRIVGVISRWLWAVGYAVGATVFFFTRSPMMLLVLVLGLFQLGHALRGPREGYFQVAPGRRLAMGALYFGLLAFLALGMWIADRPLADLGARSGRSALPRTRVPERRSLLDLYSCTLPSRGDGRDSGYLRTSTTRR